MDNNRYYDNVTHRTWYKKKRFNWISEIKQNKTKSKQNKNYTRIDKIVK